MSDKECAVSGGNARPQESKNALENLKKSVKQARIIAIILGIISIIAIGVLLGTLIHLHLDVSNHDIGVDVPKTCGQFSGQGARNHMLLDEPDNPGPLHDVTYKEIQRIRKYLVDNGLLQVKPEDAKLNDSYLFNVDLQPPEKASMLDYLDNNAAAPKRFARIVLLRGDLDPPVHEERICGPLDNIQNCNVDLSVPFAHRPASNVEISAINEFILPIIQREMGDILRQSFQGSFDFLKCKNDCLDWWNSNVPTNNYGDGDVRKLWLTPTYNWSYFALFPVDMSFLCNVDGTDGSKFFIERVWYSGEFFNSVQEFTEAYTNGTVTPIRRSYPTEEEAEYATLRHRGPFKPEEALRPPQLIEPDGQRYLINHRMVKYLDMWSFHFRMSPTYGLALYDIRFLDERIIYELSLQELAVTYSGFNPQSRNQMFVDSFYSMGAKAKALIAGVDCPSTATFVPITLLAQDKEEPGVFGRAICVFEQNSASVLKRHHSYTKEAGASYGGMADSFLVLRSIHAVDNYDYIVDFSFHQTGTIGVSVKLTGYIAANAWNVNESPHGNQIHDFIFGSMHQHLAHFKVDMDIGGSTSNQYETMEIQEDTTTLRGTNPPRDFSQIKFTYRLKETEQAAAYKYNFEKPVQHIIHNNNTRNKYGVRKSYRIVSHSNTKLLLREDIGPEPAVSWARYQLAVTKRKENEQRSASYLSQYDTVNPQVSFLDFINDNESIVDEDLVAWVSLGTYHIPHTEDLPVTTTAGKSESFYIMPYNYFTECPSMASRDAVYIDLKNPDKPEEGLNFDFYGTNDVTNEPLGGACTHRPFDFTQVYRKDLNELFEVNEYKGVF